MQRKLSLPPVHEEVVGGKIDIYNNTEAIKL